MTDSVSRNGFVSGMEALYRVAGNELRPRTIFRSLILRLPGVQLDNLLVLAAPSLAFALVQAALVTLRPVSGENGRDQER